ncbi:hypothetical protein PPACK8108_LOCUS14392 [Phakopsora pachyrhizi]|uniref:Uncharacterized protein n=1 Tax=Phakopsora pachyrhizi TaxID=170000 RepID=A0AAV0B4I1_PHAPC|nr:hypothetical protein PPACK8108_LOCUS14392 [Phakopsora pachyrhizi]
MKVEEYSSTEYIGQQINSTWIEEGSQPGGAEDSQSEQDSQPVAEDKHIKSKHVAKSIATKMIELQNRSDGQLQVESVWRGDNSAKEEEGFKGLEQDNDSTRIKGQKSRRYRIKSRTEKQRVVDLKINNINNNKKKINKNKKQYIGDLVHNIVEEEEEIAQASDNKRRMASGNSRFRRTDWAADEEVPEDIRSEPITTPDQGRRYFPRGSGRTRYEHPPETNPGSRTFGRPPSGIPRYTGHYTHQSRVNPFSNQSNRPGFTNNSQARPSYQSPLDEVHPGNDRIQTPGSRGNTGIGQRRRQLTKIKPMDKRLIFDGTNVEKFIQRYEVAAAVDGADGEDMVLQVGIFAKDEDIQEEIEEMEGYL